MATHCYVPKDFNPEKMAMIEKANEIIAGYQAAGYDLTLRQLYYQFVARNIITNEERSYKNLGTLIDDARLAGLIDWDMIVDRTRKAEIPQDWKSPENIVRIVAKQFQIDKWKNQQNRVEVWVEKEAMAGVLKVACEPLNVTHFCCRGYTSSSAAWQAAMRLKKHREAGQNIVIIHLGDHDPSGVNMSQDIEERFAMFGVPVEFHRIALNMEQIDSADGFTGGVAIPNPAKNTDSRIKSYREMLGLSDEKDAEGNYVEEAHSWELDALEPQYINRIITDKVLEFRDEDLWDEASQEEDDAKESLTSISDNFEEVVKHLNEVIIPGGGDGAE